MATIHACCLVLLGHDQTTYQAARKWMPQVNLGAGFCLGLGHDFLLRTIGVRQDQRKNQSINQSIINDRREKFNHKSCSWATVHRVGERNCAKIVRQNALQVIPFAALDKDFKIGM
jgi:hypothetical protein